MESLEELVYADESPVGDLEDREDDLDYPFSSGDELDEEVEDAEDDEAFYELFEDEITALGYMVDGHDEVNDAFNDMENELEKSVKDESSKSSVNKMLRRSRLTINKSLKSMGKLNRRRIFKRLFRSPLNVSAKVTFVTGVLGMLFMEWLFFAHKQMFPSVTCIIMGVLIIIRYIMYKKAKFQYFMLDFCYFNYLLIVFYLYVYPSPLLFPIIFVFSNGPIAVGLIVWRNSLVFHDTDKMTSVALHITPALTTYVIRWYPEHRTICLYGCQLGILNLFVVPSLLYLFWQFCYYMKVFFIDVSAMRKDPEITNSYRYNRRNRRGMIHRLIRGFGLPFNVPTFMLSQLIYTLFTMLITLPFFFHQYAHALWLGLCVYTIAYYGAKFYFEVFARLQHEKMQERLERKKHSRVRSA